MGDIAQPAELADTGAVMEAVRATSRRRHASCCKRHCPRGPSISLLAREQWKDDFGATHSRTAGEKLVAQNPLVLHLFAVVTSAGWLGAAIDGAEGGMSGSVVLRDRLTSKREDSCGAVSAFSRIVAEGPQVSLTGGGMVEFVTAEGRAEICLSDRLIIDQLAG